MKTWHTKSGCRITRISTIRFNAYLISTGNRNILVDTGMRFTRCKLLQHFGRIHYKIDYLFLTHTHFDHCQNAAHIQRLTDCSIIIDSHADPFVRQGYTPIPEGTGFFSKVLVRAGRKLHLKLLTYQPFSADLLIHGTYILSDPYATIRIIKTPGHSIDSISMIIDDEIALTGDTLFGVFRNGIFPPFADDVPEMIKSWKILLNTGCEFFLPGHGRAISKSILKKYVEKYHSQ